MRGVTLHHMREVEDMRGNLSVAELGREVPFDVKRYFLVYGVPNMEIRGEHAHLQCHQFLIAVKGSLHVVADDGRQREEIVLDRPSLGLHLPPMTWGMQYRYSADAVLLVLASHHYDAADYVRDHDQFRGPGCRRAAGTLSGLLMAKRRVDALTERPVIRQLARVLGKSIVLRNVQVEDAEFILSLRLDPQKGGYLSPVEARRGKAA